MRRVIGCARQRPLLPAVPRTQGRVHVQAKTMTSAGSAFKVALVDTGPPTASTTITTSDPTISMPVPSGHHAGRLAIVTGASRGIGAAIAHSLASKGANILLNYSAPGSAADTDAVKAALQKISPSLQIEILQADLGSLDGPQRLVDFAKDKFDAKDGRFQIDIIINNAGISHNMSVAEFTIEEFDLHYRINVLGPLLLMKAAAPYLPRDRSGRIVNISSVSATLGLPKQSVYGGTKAALDAMTRTWAREFAENATVNAVNPGPVATRMYETTTSEFLGVMKPFLQHSPLAQLSKDEEQSAGAEAAEAITAAGGRQATPEEIAGIVGMLCSAESSWCTGSVVSSNGGMIMGLT